MRRDLQHSNYGQDFSEYNKLPESPQKKELLEISKELSGYIGGEHDAETKELMQLARYLLDDLQDNRDKREDLFGLLRAGVGHLSGGDTKKLRKIIYGKQKI